MRAHSEGARQPRQPRADAPEPDDQQGLAGELVLALRQVGDHAAPVPPGLVVAGEVQLARQRQDQRHGVLRHRLGVDALRARQPDAGGGERVATYWSVPALIDWMKASRGARAMNSLRHIIDTHSTSNSPSRAVKLVEGADLEMADAGVAQREPFRHAIGDMGKADRQVVLGGDGAHVGAGA